MDHRLTNIQNDDLIPSKNAGKFCYQSGMIVPGKMDEDGLAEIS